MLKFTSKTLWLGDCKLVLLEAGAHFKISASSRGVSIVGDISLKTKDELEAMAEAVARAWQWYEKLRKEENGLSMEPTN